MALELSPPKRLGKIVVLGYCDIGAAGIRVLHGLSGEAEANVKGRLETGQLHETGRESLKFSGMGDVTFQGLPAMEAVHLEHDTQEPKGDKQETPAITLIKLNAEVAEELSASLALAIADLLGARGAALQAFVVVAAVQTPKRNQMARRGHSSAGTPAPPAVPPDAVCAFSSTSGEREHDDASPGILSSPAVTKLARLPSNARITDSFLTNLVALCRLEGVPLLLIARLGYRATGAAPSYDGTDQAVTDLGSCLGEILELGFDAEKAWALSWDKAWKRTAPTRTGVSQGYI